MKIKNLLFASLTLVLLSGCNSEPEAKKTFAISKSYEYQKSGRNGEWNMSRHNEYNYDKAGNCIQNKTFAYINGSAVIEEQSTSAYDDAGRKISFDDISYNTENGEIRSRSGGTYENYDSFGNYRKQTSLKYTSPFETPSETSVKLYEFDSNGKKTKEITEDEVVNFDYFSNGLIKTKTFSDIVNETTQITHKIEYTYYENSELLKNVCTYYYTNGAYNELPYFKDHFEYDENGFMTLYESYTDNVLDGSMEREIISEVTYKETYKYEIPDAGFAVASVSEKTFLNHESMMNNDDYYLVSEIDKNYDAFLSTIYPTSKIIRTYSFENNLYKEYVSETISYQSNSDVESSYFAFKEVNEYIEL